MDTTWEGGMFGTIILIAILIGLIPAAIARSKGRSFFGWWIYGALIWIIAMPHALVVKPSKKGLERRAAGEGQRKCLACAEWIKAEAKICRFCQTAVEA